MNASQMKTMYVLQDMDIAISVMRKTGQWMLDSGKKPSKWWQPQNMNKDFFSEYAEPEDFYTAIANGKPAAAAIFQWNQRNQDWSSVDQNESQKALYIHWLCVDREFAQMDMPKLMIDFAGELAQTKQVTLLRVDTNADEKKLRGIYEKLGFQLVKILEEEYRTTAFYEKDLVH